ncbi:MAG: hypothetical protein NTY95_08635, partial [Bacteroidia bacterium]|nr:hypothetical protein [Bacteroidia bacterium]
IFLSSNPNQADVVSVAAFPECGSIWMKPDALSEPAQISFSNMPSTGGAYLRKKAGSDFWGYTTMVDKVKMRLVKRNEVRTLIER